MSRCWRPEKVKRERVINNTAKRTKFATRITGAMAAGSFSFAKGFHTPFTSETNTIVNTPRFEKQKRETNPVRYRFLRSRGTISRLGRTVPTGVVGA